MTKRYIVQTETPVHSIDIYLRHIIPRLRIKCPCLMQHCLTFNHDFCKVNTDLHWLRKMTYNISNPGNWSTAKELRRGKAAPE